MTYMENTERLFELMGKAKAAESDGVVLYRNQIVELNLRLVAHVLKKYRPYTDDQYQGGCMGLIVAVDTYRKDTGVPFVNYACFCIEREIHKMHRSQKKWIENILKDQMIFLDEERLLGNGEVVQQKDLVPDILAGEEIDNILAENDLSEFFTEVIIPAVEDVADSSKGKTKIDLNAWKNLEIQYIVALAEVDSQKARITYSAMAKIAGVSVQNIKERHRRVIETIKLRCRERGYDVQ